MNIVVATGRALFKRAFRRDAKGRFAGGSGAAPARGSGNPMAGPARRVSSQAERIAGVQRRLSILENAARDQARKLQSRPDYLKNKTVFRATQQAYRLAQQYRSAADSVGRLADAGGERGRRMQQARGNFRVLRADARAFKRTMDKVSRLKASRT